MKKIIGYGYKLNTETIKEAFDNYHGFGAGVFKTKRKAKQEIAEAKSIGEIPKNCKPKIFRVIVELENN